ncbi:MAG: serine hydrolase [Candidatus Pacebacteria bacterium]|nr:serine hydrolase [Candidatus Paceibacterota bacterium]
MKILEKFNETKGPGYAVTVVQEGKEISHPIHGYADLENSVLISEATNFRLASVSKQFIAVAVLVLVQNKKLALEDGLRTFFRDFPDYGKDITLYQLLTHTSGLRDYESLSSGNTSSQVHDEDVFVLLKNEKGGLFEPGAKYSYSNGGYCLLRLIIEKVSGQDIGSFMRERIFQPLGMNSTAVNFEGESIIPDRAYGYSLQENDQWIRTDQDKTSATIGDGGIYSSIVDMRKWDQVLYTDIIMVHKHVLTDEGEGVYYGFGLCLKEHNNRRVAYHGGSSIGFQTGVYYLLDERMSVVFLSNRTGEEGSSIVEQLADDFLATNVYRDIHESKRL